MRNEVDDNPGERSLFSSELSPGPTQKRLALFSVLCFVAAFFLVIGPFSSVQLGQVPGFVPAYATAVFVSDLITAVLLFAQFSILRSRALLVIASGYVFTALIVIPWTLTLAGVVGPTALIGGRAEHGMALLFLAQWFCIVRSRVCLVEGNGSQQTILGGQCERGDRSQRRPDGCRGLGSGIPLHGGRGTIAPHLD